MHPQRGFTLVELMVSLALLGMVMTIVFSLFSTTSDGLKEADSLVDTLDRARFALSRVSGDFKSAAAFSTPDSSADKWVIKNPANTLCVSGVSGYSGWQNSTDLLNAAGLLSAHTIGGDPEEVSYDGVILMGAFDFPQTFEVADITVGSTSTAVIPDHAAGMIKLLANNPFSTKTSLTSDEEDDLADLRDAFVDSLPGRILRVADRDGKLQFAGITEAEDNNENGVKLTLSLPLQVRDGSGRGGIDPPTLNDADVGYEAALIDAYWYHVEADPRDPSNFRLVRERLNAGDIAAELCTPGDADPAESRFDTDPSTPDVEGSKIVITDRVADFQVWFDCAGTNGYVDNTTGWVTAWASPDGNGVRDADLGCADVADPAFGEARMAHVRLSVRTRDERKDAPDEPEALFMDETGVANPNIALRYFNIYPDAPGAARVVTVQADVELTTFSMRNISPTTGL